MKTFHILQLAGFGDTLSAITRLPAVKEKYPNYKIKFWLGGFGKSPLFSKQQLEREGYEAALIKNLTFHNQLPQMRDFIMTKFVKDGDRIKTVAFGDPNMRIKKNQKGRRSNFRSRHNCDNPGPKTKARYWSCKAW